MKNYILKRAFLAFSLIELMISLIVISCITAAFAPVVTKKLKNSNVSVSMNASSNECKTTECETGYYLENSSCECKTCSNKFLNCIECNSEKCTKCNTPYAPNTEGRCEECSDDTISDGTQCLLKSVCDNPPEGYFCDGNVMKRCVDKYSNYCKTCNSTGCTQCQSYYYLLNGNCESCNMIACNICTSTSYCVACDGNWVLDITTHKCSMTCEEAIPNCSTCTDATACTSCNGGYYLNSSKTCTSCSTISNCFACSNSSTCTKCNTGYYVNSSNSCSQCTVANCAQCDRDGTCASCVPGYHVSSSKTTCEADDNKFNCSDSNFMQIGNLCVTRKNMGDSSVLPIPSSVVVAQAGSDYCYSGTQKCCWKGTTSTACNSEYGGYDGCTRTVCNWEAAGEICSKFTYGGKNWRLPTKEEMASWGTYSIGLSSNGLMFCDYYTGYSSTRCAFTGRCPGAYITSCRPNYVWSRNINNTSAYMYYLTDGQLKGPSTYSTSAAFSVRCVSEIE